MNVNYKPIVPQQKLYKNIVNQIRKMILSGELKKGDQLPSERDMAQQFGVSRTAVREAIKSLSEIGLIDIMVGRGTFVANNTADRIVESVNLLLDVEKVVKEDLHYARKVLEAPIAKLAAKNRKQENIDQLQFLIEKMEKSKNHTKKFIEVDMEFHVELAKASGNSAFVVLTQAIMQILRSDLTFVLNFQDQTETALSHHKKILKNIVSQDIEGAELAMQSHMHQVGNVLESQREEK
ncbi:MAG: FadR family transcriptional regulator [Candidatus Marinimicrobia bacterium]|jgi:GntR family transcriptional repressor for pyruvate dehydrogenase complex|nr:FadR family transcriptional regulator [Candidatus Neomarinimicrobiota bacterium]MBT3936650.1 FadR family transcriptional regulator [Candidatus Neomarinimicrobiota bacterium]MBT3961678.1 FadR family transcriptional regulator [Candidatus Neomarinimicrobiota bacterium]MBT4382127.1 FadR family transcriptional regulator [Candidatus Neomarinimicrobiota bacterium]MBT4636784.1 FadR family transcriptional regulator [Candidatus Neomarinimicrobiota bacterium]